MTDLAARFFADTFFSELAVGAEVVARAQPGSEALAQLYDARLSPSLARFVDFFTTHERHQRYGAFGWFGAQGGTTIDWLPGTHDALLHALGQPYRIAPALGFALSIGCDHGGNPWLVALDAHDGNHEVFFHDQDMDELIPACASLEAFALVMHLDERGDDPTDAERAALVGRVSSAPLARHLSIFAKLGPSAFTAGSSLPQRHAAHARLRMVLADRDRPSTELRALPASIEPTPTNASDVLAGLLCCYLRGDDARLEALLSTAHAHPARLVRDAARVLAARSGSHGDTTNDLTERLGGLLPQPAPRKR